MKGSRLFCLTYCSYSLMFVNYYLLFTAGAEIQKTQIQNTKVKSVGNRVCDCHVASLLAMTNLLCILRYVSCAFRCVKRVAGR
jgi:hypothetical protein